jgi:hypothetical protein
MENNGCSTKVNINNLIHTHNSYSFSSSSYSSSPTCNNNNHNNNDNDNNKNNLIIQQLKNVIIYIYLNCYIIISH